MALLLLVAVRGGLDLHWHYLDNGLPDGDEAGHQGAIELYRGIVEEQGLIPAVRSGFLSSSEYPPLYPLISGALLAWFHVDGPFPRGVPGLLVVWMGLTLLAVTWMTAEAQYYPWGRVPRACVGSGAGGGRHRPGRASVTWAGVLAAAVYATSPLAAALGRHTMLEPSVAFWVAVSLACAFATRQFTRTVPTFWLGVSLSLGFLTKQTFLLYLIGPLLLLSLDALVAHRRRAAARLLVLLLVAAPLPLAWTWLHRHEQAAYGLASAMAKARVGLGYHLLYYPAGLAGLGLGAVWVLPAFLAVFTLFRHRRWRLPVALLLVMVTLTAVPKKYPRLLVPAMPLVATVTALGLVSLSAAPWRRIVAGTAAVAGLLQQAVVTVPVGRVPARVGTWRPAFFQAVDPGCPQQWIRGPRVDDLGFADLLDVVAGTGARHRAGSWVGMVDEPTIPCRYETTFHYAYHLHAYLRRHGVRLDGIPVYARDPGAFLAAAEALEVVIATEPWCQDGDVPPLAEDWTPPSITWREARLDPGAFETQAAPGHAGGAGGKPRAVPTLSRPDLCALRTRFVLETYRSYRNPALPFQLYVYRRVLR